MQRSDQKGYFPPCCYGDLINNAKSSILTHLNLYHLCKVLFVKAMT